MDYLKNNSEKGFTFLEFIITFFVVTVGLVGVFGMAPYMTSQINSANHRLVATHLAQEGIEIVKNIRDYNMLNSGVWNTNLTNGDYESVYNSDPSATMSAFNPNNRLCFSAGFYSYSCGGSSGIFNRKINIQTISADEIKVTSTVSWSEKGVNRQALIEDHLYNYWQ